MSENTEAIEGRWRVIVTDVPEPEEISGDDSIDDDCADSDE